MSGYYGASIRGAVRLVRVVPRAWPAPLRVLAEILLALVGVAFVIASWLCVTAILIIGNAGTVMGRGTNNVPPY